MCIYGQAFEILRWAGAPQSVKRPKAGPMPVTRSGAILMSLVLAPRAAAQVPQAGWTGAAGIGAGAVFSGRSGQLAVPLPRQEAAVVVNGVLDEAAWGAAAHLTGFSQYNPQDGLPADDSTDVLVWYGADAIYFGIRAFAPPGAVRATVADRDKIGSDDYVQILLDTFNDRRRALVFAVNPLGAQADGTRGEGLERRRGGINSREASTIPDVDLNQDFVFDSKGRITENGYEVEVRIPFKSIRFQSAAVQDWGINVIRQVQYSGHQQTWTAARKANASFLGQSGTLTGLTGFSRALILDINPVLTARMDGVPRTGGVGWDYQEPDPELGGNVRWGVTANFTLNGTVNPDFSQVEADVQQLQTDPRRALFFPEKRPFFLEGAEQFETRNRLIYTRRIVSPISAVKLNGKVSGTSLGLLSAVDGKGNSVTGTDNPIFNILRVQRDLGSQSTMGLVYTDRIDGNNYNRVAAADMRLVFAELYSASFQFAESFSRSAGITTNAPLWEARFGRSGRALRLDYSIQAFHQDFQAASGFVSRTDHVNIGLRHDFTFFGGAGAALESWTTGFSLAGNWFYDQFFEGTIPNDPKLHFNNSFVFRGGWALKASVFWESFKYDPRLYEGYYVERTLSAGVVDTVPYVGTDRITNYDYSLSLTTPQFSTFSGALRVLGGRDENFFEWAPAFVNFITFVADWRPTDKVRVNFRYPLQMYVRVTDWSTVARRQVPRLKVEYQLSRAIFLRLVGQYDAQFVDGLRDDSRTNDPILLRQSDGTFVRTQAQTSNDFRVDWLFSYRPNPGTVLFAGYGASLSETEAFDFRSLRRTNDGFFVKLSYLFRM